jgi:hypothetical protein
MDGRKTHHEGAKTIIILIKQLVKENLSQLSGTAPKRIARQDQNINELLLFSVYW